MTVSRNLLASQHVSKNGETRWDGFDRARILRSQELWPEMGGTHLSSKEGRVKGRANKNGGKEGTRASPRGAQAPRESETFCLSRRRRHRRRSACAARRPPSAPVRSLLQSEAHGKQTIRNSDGRRGREGGREGARQLVTIPVLKSCVLRNGTEWMHAPRRAPPHEFRRITYCVGETRAEGAGERRGRRTCSMFCFLLLP